MPKSIESGKERAWDPSEVSERETALFGEPLHEGSLQRNINGYMVIEELEALDPVLNNIGESWGLLINQLDTQEKWGVVHQELTSLSQVAKQVATGEKLAKDVQNEVKALFKTIEKKADAA